MNPHADSWTGVWKAKTDPKAENPTLLKSDMIGLLEKQNVTLRGMIDHKNANIQTLQDENAKLRAGSQNLEAENAKLRAGLQNLEAENAKLRAGSQNLKAENAKLRAGLQKSKQQLLKVMLQRDDVYSELQMIKRQIAPQSIPQIKNKEGTVLVINEGQATERVMVFSEASNKFIPKDRYDREKVQVEQLCGTSQR